MALQCSGARHGLRTCILGLAATTAVLTITSDAADARHYRHLHAHFAAHSGRGHRHGGGEAYAPPTASIIVDGNSGTALEESNPDAPRHPASLTKIMTLYLLFEQLDAGKIKLDSPLTVSAHASVQAPTKLCLKPGQTIAVEDAIKGVVTKSANDAAVVIAENLGGDEGHFAELMTQKAHALGMSRTTYVNASGLPNDDQITTARDQALLGRAIQERFPRYYRYFSTPTFVYHGEAMRNHDHLLGSMAGVDGIKTGFTEASGFNLVTSVHRDGRYVVGVVLGGRSASARDEHMRELIDAHFKSAALRRTAPSIVETAEQKDAIPPVAFAKEAIAKEAMAKETMAKETTASHADPASAATTKASAAPGSSDPIKPVLVRTVTYRTAPVEPAALAAMPALVPVSAPASAPAAAPVAAQNAVHSQISTPVNPSNAVVASAEPAAVALPAAAAEPEPVTPESGKPDAGKPDGVKSAISSPASSAPSHGRGGWLIQIGAFDAEDEARQHLSAAQLKVQSALAAADPFTERVQKGDKALYRARFAGFDRETAEDACKQLKRSEIECMALKD
jgi:D-alanyl-D-alanine carboxypeptidase